MKIVATSESALVCNLPPPASLEKQQHIWAFAELLQNQPFVVEVVIGVNNLTVFVDFPLDFSPLIEQLQQLWKTVKVEQFPTRHIEIPVIYGGTVGQDLKTVAEYHHISVEQVIEMHSTPIYTVFMLGFQPGFPYLGGLPESLHTPRLATPRSAVPAGSVGIGGSQTGIYPFSSPAGWHLIGHTETLLFDKQKMPPTLLKPGDTVKFIVQGVEL